MAQPDARFLGNIPELYDRHLGPVIFEPFALELATRVGKLAPRSLLEVAAGTGIVTRRMLEQLPPSSKLTVTDLNEPMLDHARRAVPDDARVTWRTADAMALPFEDAAFDAYVCQFGFMFFPDKLVAAREAKRVLKPGGRLLFSVWDRIENNAFAQVANATIASFFPSDPPKFYQTPFGWHDEREIRRTLEAARFRDIRVDAVKREGVSSSAQHFATGLVQGNPVAIEIAERGSAPIEAVVQSLAQALVKIGGEKPLRTPLSTFVIEAVA
jgi:ubiquinone/menaquinone biosynthesis C-methylase UbiE